MYSQFGKKVSGVFTIPPMGSSKITYVILGAGIHRDHHVNTRHGQYNSNI